MQPPFVANMFWTTGFALVALTFSQVPAALAKPGVFVEDADAEALTGERIISGWEAYPGQFPYVVSIRGVVLTGGLSNCAASVVNRDWILTTASCASNRNSMIVRAGVTDLTTTPEYLFETREWWVHPDFNSFRPLLNNIAIVKLQRTLTYNKLVQPIRIQPLADAFLDYDNEVVIASGWGRPNASFAVLSNVLNWVYLRAISNQECSGDNSTSNDHYMCTRGYNVTSQSTCDGDEGGPLVHVGHDGEPMLVGMNLITADYNCGRLGNPAVYTRPGFHHRWLNVVTGINFEEALVVQTTEATEPPTTEVTEPPTTEVTEPLTTEVPELSTTEATKPPTTKVPEPVSSSESDNSSNESDSSESKEAPIVSKHGNKKVINKLKVKVINSVNIK